MKPGIPKGTRDFSPLEMMKRNFIFDTIRNVYQRYGYQQIETPTMENLSTLEGKYGEEGDKLLFRILNSGINFSELKPQTSDLKHSDIAEKGLRYDLTVPFARYVVMHQNEITFPFKRFQIQPVWRADRPQKGRYREFYQCDADVIGSTSLLNEVELIQIIDEVFSALGIKTTIKINNRKLLLALAHHLNIGDNDFIEFVTLIDKIDKVGRDQVLFEITNRFKTPDTEWRNLFQVLHSSPFPHNITGKLEILKEMFANSDIGKKGIEEVEEIVQHWINNDPELISNFKSASLELDLNLARGLNYYTGTIIEVKVADTRSTFTSSICGGGRYDDLTGIFGLPNVSGVGISFGADRIYDVLEEMNAFPDLTGASTKIMFVNFGKDEAMHCLKLLKQLREAGINSELFPDQAKMKKQMGYADDKKIPFVALIGSEEMKSGEITIKNMVTGEQSKVKMDELMIVLKGTK